MQNSERARVAMGPMRMRMAAVPERRRVVAEQGCRAKADWSGFKRDKKVRLPIQVDETGCKYRTGRTGCRPRANDPDYRNRMD